jgi:predicted ATP-dependent endonuclease of OLD family
MHPQMERKMRDALFRLATQLHLQVICTTHSPVFLDMGRRHKSIVRIVKAPDRTVEFLQVTQELFEGEAEEAERERLRLVSAFHPTVNEVFFARRVVLLEEHSAVAAFLRAAELTGLFERHPHLRRDVTLIDADGKGSIPLFQRVLNHFLIPYTVVHDEDQGNANAPAENARIGQFLPAPHGLNRRHMISPTDLEALLGYVAPRRDKVFRALRAVEDLHAGAGLPAGFIEAVNWVYFGQSAEPPAPMA